MNLKTHTTQFHTLVFNMQHEKTTDSCISTQMPLENFMFLQIIDEYPSNYLVKIDPIQDKIIYEDLLEFERSKITIQMNNYQPESLYMLYEGNVCRPERYTAWSNFFRNICFNKIPEKSEYILLDRENLHKIQKARWCVCQCLR